MALDIGVDIGGTNIKLGLVDAQGRVVARGRLKTEARKGPRQALERVAAGVARLRKKHVVRSVGVGIAGLVDHEHGIVRLPPNLPGWHGTGVKEILEELTGLDVHVTNDVNAVCLGEWLFGAGRGCDDLFCLTLGTGVGGAAIVNGRLALGANGAAGELGHTVIFGNGLPCRCGGRGCLERYVGAKYIVRRARARVKAEVKRMTSHRDQMPLFKGGIVEKPSVLAMLPARRLDPETIGRAARDGDRLALELVQETGDFLGLGLVNVVALFDPARIIIGGGIAGLGEPLLKAARRTVLRRGQLFDGRKLEIVPAALGNDAGIAGASRLGRLPAPA
jgi:glucokinase